MGQVHAGETITLTLDNQDVTVKIEDASKSDVILVKILAGDSPAYHIGQIYELSRNVLNSLK